MSDIGESLLVRRPTKGRKSVRFSNLLQQPKQISHPPINPVIERNSYESIKSQDLQWQKSQQLEIQVSPRQPRQSLKFNYWNDDEREIKQKTRNDKIFTLAKAVQQNVYWVNFLFNFIVRGFVLVFLVFLAMQKKWLYLQIFLGLQCATIVLYIIIMIKMLFTRSDKESVYFQKILNESDWADIESERVMRRHFSARKILGKVQVLINPCSKFNRDLRISLLRQDLFKRIQIIFVQVPFVALFLISKDDFYTQRLPNYPYWVNGGICFQVIRTVVTEIIIMIFS